MQKQRLFWVLPTRKSTLFLKDCRQILLRVIPDPIHCLVHWWRDLLGKGRLKKKDGRYNRATLSTSWPPLFNRCFTHTLFVEVAVTILIFLPLSPYWNLWVESFIFLQHASLLQHWPGHLYDLSTTKKARQIYVSSENHDVVFYHSHSPVETLGLHITWNNAPVDSIKDNLLRD